MGEKFDAMLLQSIPRPNQLRQQNEDAEPQEEEDIEEEEQPEAATTSSAASNTVTGEQREEPIPGPAEDDGTHRDPEPVEDEAPASASTNVGMVRNTNSGRKYMPVDVNHDTSSPLKRGIVMARNVCVVASMLLSALAVLKRPKSDEVGVVFYLSCFFLVVFECLEAHSQVSNVGQAWMNIHFHRAVVNVAFCLGKVTILPYWMCMFVLMIKELLKVLKAEFGSKQRELGRVLDSIDQNYWINRVVAALEILIAPWLFTLSVVRIHFGWLAACGVYIVMYLMYQVEYDIHHQWLDRKISSKLRQMAMSDENGLGKMLNELLQIGDKFECLARKLYPGQKKE